ncbi:restriction endonuclease [Litoribacillus peritrichatus]|uniref:Restriction endonuclease type IV Mrr domain-containing protein n=1 Tax=Litoribacillus peritrichatus TaxID=718191 RepID=A0ABP7N0E0_9GAMM
MAKRKSSDGKEYEKLAEDIFKKIFSNNVSAVIDRDVKLESEFGERQFDVVVSNVYEDYKVSVVVECKDYGRPIDIFYIDAYVGKLQDFDVKQSIFIAKNGFTANALKKAAANGVVCCTAQEACHPDWNIDTLIEVYLMEVMPTKLSPRCSNVYIRPGESFSIRMYNGIDAFSLFEDKWKNGDINLPSEGECGVITFKEIAPPYCMDFTSKEDEIETRDIGELTFTLAWKRRYFKTTLDKIKKTQLLQFCGKENAFHLFLDRAELSKYEESMTEITKEDIDSSKGIVLMISSKPEVKFAEMKLEDFIAVEV